MVDQLIGKLDVGQRVDIPLGIAYKENIPKAREVLLQAVSNLDGVNLEVRVWIGGGNRTGDLLPRDRSQQVGAR